MIILSSYMYPEREQAEGALDLTWEVAAASSWAALYPATLIDCHRPVAGGVILKCVRGQITDLQLGEIILEALKSHPERKERQERKTKGFRRKKKHDMIECHIFLHWNSKLVVSSTIFPSGNQDLPLSYQNSPCWMGSSLFLSWSECTRDVQASDMQLGEAAMPQGSRRRTRRIRVSFKSFWEPWGAKHGGITYNFSG